MDQTIAKYILQTLLEELKQSSDSNILNCLEERRLCYLDDNAESRRAFMDIINRLHEAVQPKIPGKLKGAYKELEQQEIKQLLSDSNILIYGRSGMKLNSKELLKYSN